MDAETTADVADVAPPVVMQSAPRSDRSVVREMEREDDKSVREWLDSLAGDSAIKVMIRRQKPTVGPNGENIAGMLETVDQKIDEDYLREMWGGGRFLLQVQTPKPNGGWKILRTRTLDIAGPPKMGGQVLRSGGDGNATPISSAADDSLAERAFTQMAQLAQDERARADRMASAPQQRGFDVDAMSMLQQPLIAQIASANSQIAQLQQQLLQALNKPPQRDEFRDEMMKQALSDDNRRIEGLRAQYELRIDTMRDAHENTLKRIEERHEKAIERLEQRHADEVRRLEAAHERDLRQADKMGEVTSRSLDVANVARVESLAAEKERMSRELATAQARIAALEAKKDQTISEKADEILKVKEALDGLGGGGDDDDNEQKWYMKALDLLGNSEAALKLVDKIGGGPEAQAAMQQQQQQLPPPGVPFQGPDGNVYMQHPNGSVVMLDPRMVAAQQKRALMAARQQRKQKPGASPTAPQADADHEAVVEAAPPIKPPSGKDIKTALQFMESAFKNNTDPVRFAATARNLVPQDVLRFVQRVGIEKLLDTVVEPGSALATIRGRQFARSFAAALVGASPEAAPAPVAVVVTTAGADPGGDDDIDDDALMDDALNGEVDDDDLDDQGGQ